jgi:teichuronic acid biosynthesis glycosyltransferase TuaG
MSQLVSVIMPAYNAGRYIAESIRSVLEQTYANWELVVVDDGSTDDTAALVRDFAAADERIRYFHQPNGRLGKARNTGLRFAAGELVAFLDSDDLWMPEKLALQVEALNAHDADVVYSDGFIFSDDDVADDTTTFPILPGRQDGERLFDQLLLGNRIAVLSVMLRRTALERAGLFEEETSFHGAEDYDLWLRLAKGGAVFYGMTERLVRYRRHSAAMTSAESKLLKPALAVVKRHAASSKLGEGEVRRRLQWLYRDIISALVREGLLREARVYMEEFAAWDRGALVTKCQKLLLRLSPRGYNFISRECLYRAEWHARRLSRRSKRAGAVAPIE